jgi:pimeloyl-ACP methyl ester carboxylesterase
MTHASFASIRFRRLATLAGAVLLAGWVASATGPGPVLGQDAAGAKKDGPLKMPPKEQLTLVAKDGVSVSCDYFPGGFVKAGETVRKIDGKSVVPIIMVHGWAGQATDYERFALGLQNVGYAVVVPDLRGHGRSRVVMTPLGPVEVDLDRVRLRELQSMILDIEAVKKFLLEKNNQGEVNIEMLGIIGSDVGALLAINWSVVDWSKRQLPAFKQGRDVKAMVLLSPEESFRGVQYRDALQHPVVSAMPTLIAVGAGDSKITREADRLKKLLERNRRNAEESLVLVEAGTTLQGVQLLQPSLPVANEVWKFFQKHLAEQGARYPWSDRPNPLGGDD